MTPGARISAAIEVLDQVFAGLAAEQALTRWARAARYAGSKDRAAVRDHVFQALRCRRSYAAFGGGEDGRSVMIGALRANGLDPATLFTGEGHAPRSLTGNEAAVGPPNLSQAQEADLPYWLWQVFEEDLGVAAREQARAQRQRAPIALRVNIRLKTVAQVIENLSEEGVEGGVVPGCDTAIIVTKGARRIRQSQAYLTGMVEMQDVSSQMAMARIALPPRAKVLDYCAGGGGKTLALAANGPGGADAPRFFVHDIDKRRMADLPSRAARAGVEVAMLSEAQIAGQAPFDLILCDVPCTGSGTWRRTPDAKWRLNPKKLEKFQQVQMDILHAASDFPRPGGQLIYTTCSVLARENAAQIEAFLQAHPAFTLQQQVLTPVTEMHDGFFFASLLRNT